MNEDEFWYLIEASRGAGLAHAQREAFLAKRLWRAPRRQMLDFVQHLSATREPANTGRLWRAADIIMDGHCSTDSFHYFQMWLVGLGLGREAYDAAIADPDTLAAIPEVRRLAPLSPGPPKSSKIGACREPGRTRTTRTGRRWRASRAGSAKSAPISTATSAT